ncbi:hypothetical protein NEOKW01_1190 [Nematocida sp. AWRm80]|nr:hypothetical protein NEOKW01_1190 [Nematocida sp. AWRm80]
MTVLIDTFDVPAHTIMSLLYQAPCQEVFLDEIYSRKNISQETSKKYTILKDISPRVLLAVRDIENIIYIIHKEILSEKEYSMLRYYANEIIIVQGNTVCVINKKRKKYDLYKITKKIDSRYRITQVFTRIESSSTLPEPYSNLNRLSDKQEIQKYQSLPYLHAQKEKEVYFPEEQSSEELSEEEEEEDS